MKNKQENWMLGFNQKGMEKGGKTILKLFAFLGILFGLGMMLASVWIGLIIMVVSGFFWYFVSKSKTKLK